MQGKFWVLQFDANCNKKKNGGTFIISLLTQF